jgi:hypothetical protein
MTQSLLRGFDDVERPGERQQSAALNLPSPGISRSMTNLGMLVLMFSRRFLDETGSLATGINGDGKQALRYCSPVWTC